jgi:hypothetical protein
LKQRKSSIGSRLLAGAICAAVLAVALAAWGTAARADAYVVETPPWLPCFLDGQAEKASLEASLSPANGATAQVGQAIEFSGHSNAPLSFAIASSAAQLSSPDIASGSGAGNPSETDGGSTCKFSSPATTQSVRTIYWQVSFQEPVRLECPTPGTITSAARSLMVVAAPTSAATPAPAETEEASCTVPKLRGDSLPKARNAIVRAGCAVGVVKRPRHEHGALAVVGQGPSPATVVAVGGRVDLTLGARADSRKRNGPASHRGSS